MRRRCRLLAVGKLFSQDKRQEEPTKTRQRQPAIAIGRVGDQVSPLPTIKVREGEYPRPGRHDVSFKLPRELFRLEAIALFQ